MKLGRFDSISNDFVGIFHCVCTEAEDFFIDRDTFSNVLAILSLGMRRNGGISVCGPTITITVVLSNVDLMVEIMTTK